MDDTMKMVLRNRHTHNVHIHLASAIKSFSGFGRETGSKSKGGRTTKRWI